MRCGEKLGSLFHSTLTDSRCDCLLASPDHLGLIKTAIGAAAGGVVGLVLFRSGPNRAASVAAGVGVAFGSTYERIAANYNKSS
jgi:hypothetical protein